MLSLTINQNLHRSYARLLTPFVKCKSAEFLLLTGLDIRVYISGIKRMKGFCLKRPIRQTVTCPFLKPDEPPINLK